MEDEAWIADYFSVVGARNDGDLDLLDPELHSPEMLKCVWEDAITDIAVVRTGKGEVCPEGYELIDRTPMGHDADLNHGSVTSWGLRRAIHLAVRRQHVSQRDDYIAEIQVVFSGDAYEVPEGQGWELVEKSASGKGANLNKVMECTSDRNIRVHRVGGDDALLAVRRAVRDLVDCPAAVCSVCVLLRNKEEHPPPGYRVIQKDLNRGKSGDVVQLGYQVGGALSTVRLPFRSMILDRYPEQDSPLFPFPGDQLPMFVYPKVRGGAVCVTEAARGRMRMGSHGSKSYGRGLSSLSQSSRKVRPLSSTGSWSGGDLGAAAAAAASGWPPQAFVRAAGGGVGAAAHMPSLASSTSTSWTKLSAATLASQRFGPRAGSQHQSPTSWRQPFAAEVFGAGGAKGAGGDEDDGATAGAAAATPKRPTQREENEMSPTVTQSAAFHRGSGRVGGTGGRSGRPVDERRWEEGDVPFRDNPLDVRPKGLALGAARELATGEAKAQEQSLEGAARGATQGVAIGAQGVAEPTEGGITASASPRPKAVEPPAAGATLGHRVWVSAAAAAGRGGNDGGDGRGSSNPAAGLDDLSDEEYDLMCQREDRPCIFAPKTICVISRFPIYGVLRRFLRHLYAISLSRSDVPLERYISMFVSCIPMPPPGGCPFHVYLEHLENQDPRRSRLKPLALQMPPAAWLPLMDIDFAAPFRCLSVQSVLTVFALMLQEAKILFLSSRAELLTQVMEALRSLLFPMEWQSVYVPQLPYALAGYLECPGGFMIGMRLTKGELERGTGGTATVVRDLGLEGVANAVNLDAGEVLLYSGHLADSVAAPEGNAQQASTGSQRNSARGHQSLSAGGGGSSRRSLNNSQSSSGSSTLQQALGGMCGCGWKSLNGADSSCYGSGRNADGVQGGSFIAKDEETATPWLPVLLREDLAARLERELFSEAAGVRVGVEEELDQYESAFEFAPAPDRTDAFVPHFSSERIQMVDARGDRLGTAGDPAPTRHHGGSAATSSADDSFDTASVVRDCFLCCMSELLGGICGSLRQSEARRSRRSLRTKPLDELFNMSRFLEGMDASHGARPFLQRLTSTQMFWVMVQQWLGRSSSPTDCRLLFFEECAIAVKNRLAGAVVPWKDSGDGASVEGGGDRDRHGDGDDDDGSAGRRRRWVVFVVGVALQCSCSVGCFQCKCAQVRRRVHPPGRRGAAEAPRPVRAQFVQSVRACAAGGVQVDATRDAGVRAEAAESPLGGDSSCTPQGKGGGDSGAGGSWDGFCEVCTGPPVIIPGPTAQGIPNEGQHPSFGYDDGWPTPLNRGLLHTPPEALPPVVPKLQLHASCHASRPQGPEQGVMAGSESKRADTPAATTAAAAVDSSLESLARSMAGGPRDASSGETVPSQQGLGQSSRFAESDQLPEAPGYTGEVRLWRPHGKGRMVYSDSTVYEGEFRHGRRHGEGSMTGGGSHYAGQWTGGRRDGVGTMTYPDGSRYEGNWANDERNGQGTYCYASGAVYEGSWKEGKMHGKGRYTGASGSCYDGMYRRGVRSGHAKMEYSGGQTYEGEWADGVRSGFGTYTLADGTVFEGTFKQDKRHGAGTLRRADGVTSQLWENGKLVAESPSPPPLPP
ncbi:unnamed protein product [Ectocarpus sp. CCAP 1310/34]|nr:unnamed protein product [Ectocarpus sp. CCAP 1310/34]